MKRSKIRVTPSLFDVMLCFQINAQHAYVHDWCISVFKYSECFTFKRCNNGEEARGKRPWFSSRCRLPESLNKKPNKQTTKSSFTVNTRYASCPFSSSLKYDFNPHIYDYYDSSRVKTSASCSVLWLLKFQWCADIKSEHFWLKPRKDDVIVKLLNSFLPRVWRVFFNNYPHFQLLITRRCS